MFGIFAAITDLLPEFAPESLGRLDAMLRAHLPRHLRANSLATIAATLDAAKTPTRPLALALSRQRLNLDGQQTHDGDERKRGEGA